MRRILLSVACAAALLGATVGVATAGEITGNGKSLHPLRANSECAFSGLDDADDDGFVKTQNWGQIPKDLRAILAAEGTAPWALCNGHLNPMKR